MLISVTQWSAVICSALDSVIKEERQPQWGFIHSQALPRKHLSSIFSMKVHHFILYLVVSCLFCIEAFWFIMKHRNIHLYHSLKSGNIQYCESNIAQLCSFNLFPTLRFPPAWNPSLERRKLMILTGSKLQPTLCRKFALNWKQLNLNHTVHWKTKPFRTQCQE